ncbi:MAG: hypothetical protein SPI53_01505 [Erysipelotrichaceae bacterium]|nr:hypothetical protein [Erysipelotrichaceae bacterium]
MFIILTVYFHILFFIFQIKILMNFENRQYLLIVLARRLEYSNMNTTQKIYLHIIQELENRDIDLVMRSLSVLN